MELIANIGASVGGAFWVALSFVFALTVVVFIHEMGHFLVARWCGVSVKAFSIGFGRELWAFVDKHGTRWRVALLPLGGYVKFMDDENAASVPSREAVEGLSEEARDGAFQLKPLWQRTAVVAAGPIANFILAIIIFAVMAMVFGVTKMEPRVFGVVEGTPAAEAGFEVGDLVKSIQGEEIDEFADLQRIVTLNVGSELSFVVERGGTEIVLRATPKLYEHDDPVAGKHKRPVIGVKGSPKNAKITNVTVGPIDAIGVGAERTWAIIAGTMGYLGDIFTNRQSADQIGGVVRIADVAGKVAANGFLDLIFFTAFISVSIGLINLFPIPLLDGGHLVFYAYEAVVGKPLSETAQEYSFRIGFALIMMLMLFGFYNDRGILARWLSWPG